MKTFFLFTLFTVISILGLLNICRAQAYKYVYYFDGQLAVTRESKAVFIGKGFKEEDGLFRLDYFAKKEKNLLITAHFLDSSIATLQGQFTLYYKDGRVQNEGNYLYDQKDSLWQQWDAEGLKTDSTFYKNGKAIAIATFDYYKNRALNSYSVTDSLADIYKTISYDSNGNIKSEFFLEAEFGILKSYDSGRVYVDSVFGKSEKNAAFPGGDSSWKNYLRRNLDPATPVHNYAPDGLYKVMVRFLVAKDGRLIIVAAETNHGYGMEKEVIRMIKNSPPWEPAMQYGRKVIAMRRQPIQFSVEGN